MKIEASLLRPVVDIKGDVDFCVRPELHATVKIPPLDIGVDEIPFNATGSLIPDITIGIDPIVFSLKTEVVMFGVTVFGTSISLGVGPFTTHVSGNVNFGVKGGVGPIKGVVALRDPISMDMDGCLQGLARLNPKNPQLPACCEGYREPFCCSCDVHKDHKHCDKHCGCHPRD